MKTVTSIKQFRQIRKTLGTSKLGFVPTMGALHQGHISLLERSVGECDVTVLSIFLNPTQFNNPDDLKTYPITLQEDLEKAAQAGVDVVLLPEYDERFIRTTFGFRSMKIISANNCVEHTVTDILPVF